MSFIFCVIIAVFCLIYSIVCFVRSEGIWEEIVMGLLWLAVCIIIIIMLIVNPPHVLCPGCDAFLFDVLHFEYCSKCGYELSHHCIECGEFCYTAFCKLCGAEQ